MTEQEVQQIEAAKAALDKATPGPWRKSQSEALIHAPKGGAVDYIAMLGDTGNDFGNDLDDDFVTEEVTANMSLIAAAPALVRRVQELEDWQAQALRWLMWLHTEGTTGTDNLSDLTTLIEQAEGGKCQLVVEGERVLEDYVQRTGQR